MQKPSLRLPHGVGNYPKPFTFVHNMNTLGISVKLIFWTGLRQPINLIDPVKKECKFAIYDRKILIWAKRLQP